MEKRAVPLGAARGEYEVNRSRFIAAAGFHHKSRPYRYVDCLLGREPELEPRSYDHAEHERKVLPEAESQIDMRAKPYTCLVGDISKVLGACVESHQSIAAACIGVSSDHPDRCHG